MSDTLTLTEELLRRPSVSPEDHGCLGVIGARLAALGFLNETLAYPPVENLWSRRGTGRRASPATPTWSRPGRARTGAPTPSSR